MEALEKAWREAVTVAHCDDARAAPRIPPTHVMCLPCSRPCRLSLAHLYSSSSGTLRAIDKATHLISFPRLALFVTCRNFIDKSLYHELKQISQSTSADIPVELETLPSPSATPRPGRRLTNDTSHSLLSKTLFSLCFSESCTLFLLLMCQALDALDTR
jgi:hypothetical protein